MLLTYPPDGVIVVKMAEQVDDTKVSLHCIKLIKPACLTDVTCVFLKINRVIWLKLYSIVSFIHWIDLFL